MRIYELIFILKPDLLEEEVTEITGQFQEVITNGGGTIVKVDPWGKRRLAYEIQHHTEGHYVLIEYTLEGGYKLSKEVERRLGVSDAVIKYLTVRVDEERKKVEKLKKRREVRAARKPPRSSDRGDARPRPRTASAPPGQPKPDAPPARPAAEPAKPASQPETAKPGSQPETPKPASQPETPKPAPKPETPKPASQPETPKPASQPETPKPETA